MSARPERAAALGAARDRMRVLIVHDRFPGQFVHLARSLASDPDVDLRFVARSVEGRVAGVSPVLYKPSRPVREATHYYLRPMERAVLNGQAAFRALALLEAEGFRPDVILAHAGFGPGLYLRDAFPSARLLGYFEWYYRGEGGDAAFLSEGPLGADARCRLRTRNADILLELVAADQAITPTEFQRRQFPPVLRDRIAVLHDGVDTSFFSPGPPRASRLAAFGLDSPGPIVTYATRGMEPYRGFSQFIRAADLLLRRYKDLRVVIAGADKVAYSRRPSGPEGSYLAQALAALPDLDRSRLILTGHLDLASYRDLLRRSTVHVYLTIPFVLSWSFIEAMATGCALVASDTEPVREAVDNGKEALLVDFFDSEALANSVARLLDDEAERSRLGAAARRRAQLAYDLNDLLPRQRMLLGLPAAVRVASLQDSNK